MSFTRIHDDVCQYKQNLSENVSYISYLLDVAKFERCDKCRPEVGVVGGTNVSHVKGNLVDLESNLFGIDRPNTRCPSFKYLPSTSYVQGKEYIKPVEHPKIDVSKAHLRPCQMMDYKVTPQPPPMQMFACGK